MKQKRPFKEIIETREGSEWDWEPNIDIGETASAYVLVAEMPGVRSEDLNVVYEAHRLTIEATLSERGVEEWQSVIRDERETGSCHRVFCLPEDVDTDRRRERLHHGLLTIHLPKLVTAAVKLDAPVDRDTVVARPIPVIREREAWAAKRPPKESVAASRRIRVLKPGAFSDSDDLVANG